MRLQITIYRTYIKFYVLQKVFISYKTGNYIDYYYKF